VNRVGWLSLWIFTFCVPWQNMVMLPSVGTIGRAVGLAAGLVCCISVALRGRIWINHFMILALIFFIYSSLTILWTPFPDPVFLLIQSAFQLAAMMLLVHQFVHNSEDVSAFFLAYIFGCFVIAFATVDELFTGPEMDVTYRRFMAEGFNSNDGAYTMALAIPMAWHIALTARKWFHGLILFYVPIGFSAILLSGSRGGSVAGAVALLTPLVHVRRISRCGSVLIALGFVLLTGMSLWAVHSLVPEDTLARVGSVAEERGYSDSSAFGGRLRIWIMGLDAFGRSPLIGTGSFPETMTALYGQRLDAHNAFVHVAVNHGVIGLVLFLLLLTHLVKDILVAPVSDRRTWYVLMGVLLIPLMMANWMLTKQMWLLFALATSYAKQSTADVPVVRRVGRPVRAAIATDASAAWRMQLRQKN
jgi:O-antigen ligase/polysaccharide polymerase Wzy-like membrane protein